MDWLPQLYQYIIFAVIITISAGLGYVIRFLITRYLAHLTQIEIGRILISSIRTPLVLWSTLFGINIALGAITLPPITLEYVRQAIFIVAVLSVVFVIANISSGLLRLWGSKIGKPAAHVTGIGQFAIRVVILVIGIMIILDSLAVSITPLIASLGIGALAIALALQPTLANLFAGIYIMADKPIRVGDYIKLESGEKGYVRDIGWRSVKVRMLPNNTIIIPNQRLAESLVLNFYYPEQRCALLIEVGVSYEDDPIEVEKILVEEMVKASYEVDGMVTAYEVKPFVRFIPGYMDSSINFTCICQVREYIDRYYVQHELRKRIWERFGKEGITIPFPIRTLHLPRKYIEDAEALYTSETKSRSTKNREGSA